MGMSMGIIMGDKGIVCTGFFAIVVCCFVVSGRMEDGGEYYSTSMNCEPFTIT